MGTCHFFPSKSRTDLILPFPSPSKGRRGVDIRASGKPWLRSRKSGQPGLSRPERSPAQVRLSPPRGQSHALAQVC